MQYTFITPPASRAADRPPQFDDALVAAARRVLLDALREVQPGSVMHRREKRALFAVHMAGFCDEALRRGVAIEKLIIALKLAWASLPELRLPFGETAPDVMAGAVTSCIQAYFGTAQISRAD